MVLLKSPILTKETSEIINFICRLLGQFDHKPFTVQRLRAFFGFANSALRRKTNGRTDDDEGTLPIIPARSLASMAQLIENCLYTSRRSMQICVWKGQRGMQTAWRLDHGWNSGSDFHLTPCGNSSRVGGDHRFHPTLLSVEMLKRLTSEDSAAQRWEKNGP